jgi:hypothetical protein
MKISALLLFLSFFQTPRPPLAPITVQGRVIDAETQQPMVRATVQVTTSHGDAILARDTAADGSFTFSNVPAGDYSIEASAAGYISNSYGAQRGQSLEKSLTGIQIVLTRGGVISGRVIDDRGDVVVGATVQAMRTQYHDGRPDYKAVQTVTSDDLGEYRLFLLPPGEYRVRVTETSYVRASFPWYYPATTVSSEAQPIRLQAGQAIGGIDVASFPTRGRRVSGTLEGAQGASPSVTLASRNGEIQLSKSPDQNTGAFTFVGIPPGSYTLASNTQDLKASLSIDVRNADIPNARLILAPGVKVPARMRIEGHGDADDLELEKLYFTIRAEPAIGGLSNDVYSPFRNGRLTLDLVAGDYRIDLVRNEDMYVKSMRLGAVDVLAEGLHVPPASDAQLEVVVGTNPGSVQGRVAAAGATVVLVPDPGRRSQRVLYKAAHPGASGEFSLQKVPPGDYKLFAWREENGGPWLDPEYLRLYEDRATPVHVEQGQRLVVESLIPVF